MAGFPAENLCMLLPGRSVALPNLPQIVESITVQEKMGAGDLANQAVFAVKRHIAAVVGYKEGVSWHRPGRWRKDQRWRATLEPTERICLRFGPFVTTAAYARPGDQGLEQAHG
jgi:hypothetical protein